MPTGKRRRQKVAGQADSQEEEDDVEEEDNSLDGEDRRPKTTQGRRKLNRLNLVPTGTRTPARGTRTPISGTRSPITGTRSPSIRRQRPLPPAGATVQSEEESATGPRERPTGPTGPSSLLSKIPSFTPTGPAIRVKTLSKVAH